MAVSNRKGWWEYNRFCFCGQEFEIYSDWVAPRTFANHYYADDTEYTECPTCGRELNESWDKIFSLRSAPIHKLDKHGRLLVSPSRPQTEASE